jgi:hypothetical protein
VVAGGGYGGGRGGGVGFDVNIPLCNLIYIICDER